MKKPVIRSGSEILRTELVARMIKAGLCKVEAETIVKEAMNETTLLILDQAKRIGEEVRKAMFR